MTQPSNFLLAADARAMKNGESSVALEKLTLPSDPNASERAMADRTLQSDSAFAQGRKRRVAYADPPYIGCAHRYEGGEEVDHLELVARLNTYDTWALSCHTPSLKYLLDICPGDVRVAAWVKPFCAFKPNVNPAYAWEPVILRGLPKRSRKEPTVRDWVSANITLKKGLCGAKPPGFWAWLMDVLGLTGSEDVHDLYPGTFGFNAAYYAKFGKHLT